MRLFKIPPVLSHVRIKTLLVGRGFYAILLAGLLNFACQSEKNSSEESFASDFSKWQHYLGDPGRIREKLRGRFRWENLKS